MNASPVGTPPAGLVCVRDQQQRRLASTDLELLSSGSFCPLSGLCLGPVGRYLSLVRGAIFSCALPLWIGRLSEPALQPAYLPGLVKRHVSSDQWNLLAAR